MLERKETKIAALTLAGLCAALLAAYARWARGNPSACPYRYHPILNIPRPFTTRSRLRKILTPRPGERILEIGPGTGYFALSVARWLEPGGTLDAIDIQPQMLDHTMRRARERGIYNISPILGDASALPYPNGSFDAAYLVSVLGEIPDQRKAMSELRRVLKPGGRLVVGEALPDPHFISPGKLAALAGQSGLRAEERLGSLPGYFSRLRTPVDT